MVSIKAVMSPVTGQQTTVHLTTSTAEREGVATSGPVNMAIGYSLVVDTVMLGEVVDTVIQ